MKCSTTLKELAATKLPSLNFPTSIYTPAVKIDLLLELTTGKDASIFPDIMKSDVTFGNTSDGYATIPTIFDESIILYPNKNFLNIGTNASLAKRISKKLDLQDDYFSPILDKLDVTQPLDALLIESIVNTKAKLRLVYENYSSADASQINISIREIQRTATTLGTREEVAAKMMMLHELVHSNTVAIIEAAERGEPVAVSQLKDLDSLYARYVKLHNKKPITPAHTNSTAILSKAEFLAVAVSDKAFAQALDEADANIFETAWKFITQLLGITSPTPASVYRDLMVSDARSKIGTVQTKRYFFSTDEAEYYQAPHGKSHIMEQLAANNSKYTNALDDKGNELPYYLDENQNKVDRLTGITGRAAAFSDRQARTEDEVAELVADIQYRQVAEGGTLAIGATAKAMTKEQFIVHFKDAGKKAQTKGHIIHALSEKVRAELAGRPVSPEILTRLAEKIALFKTLEPDVRWHNFDWAEDAINDYFKNSDINLQKENNVFGTTSITETLVESKVLKFASRADLILQRTMDGKLGILDFKSGYDVLREDFHRILNEYANSYSVIGDNAQAMAKLELMLRAIAIKEQIPETQFYMLRIANVQSGAIAARKTASNNVEVRAYLDMIERMLQDKKFCIKTGLMSETDTETPHAKLLKKSPNIFKASEYYDHVDTPSVDLSTNLTVEASLSNKLTLLRSKVAAQMLTKSGADQKEIAGLTEQVLRLAALDKEDWGGELTKDLTMLDAYLGSTQELVDPPAKVWGKLYQNAMVSLTDEKAAIELKLTTLADKLYREHQKVHPNFALTKQGRVIVPTNPQKTGLYDFAYKTEVVNGISYERLYDGEVNPTYLSTLSMEDQVAYTQARAEDAKVINKMTAIQREYLTYVNSLVHRASNYMNKPQYQTGTKDFKGNDVVSNSSALDLFNTNNKFSQAHQVRKMDSGFFWKFPKLPNEKRQLNRVLADETVERAAEISNWDIKKRLPNYIRKGLVECEDREFFGENQQPLAVPIKGLGNFEVDASHNYSMDLTHSTLTGVTNMLMKEYLDDIAISGNGLITYYKQREYDTGQNYGNYIYHIENTIYRKVLGMPKVSAPGKNPPIISYVDDYGNKRSLVLSYDKILRKLGTFTVAGIMPLRILQPLGNTAQAYAVLHRDIMSNSMFSKFSNKITEEYQSYSVKDFHRAHKLTNSIAVDGATGNIRNNKLWLLAHQIGYLPKSYLGNSQRGINQVKNLAILDEQTLHTWQNVQEDFITYLTLAYQTYYVKHTKNGVTKSLIDWYEVVDGKLTWTGGSRGMQESIHPGGKLTAIEGITNKEIIHMKAVYEHLQGGYRTEELAPIESTALGSLFMSLMRWLPRLLHQAFHSAKQSTVLGKYIEKKDNDGNILYYTDSETNEKVPIMEWEARVTEGKWNSLWAMVKDVSQGKPIHAWRTYTPARQKNLVEAVIALSIWGLSWLAYAIGVPDDEEDTTENKMIKRYLIDNLSQQYNPANLADNIVNLGNIMALERTYEFSQNFAQFLMALALMQVKDGDAKSEAIALVRSTPYANQVLDTYRKLEESEMFEDSDAFE